MVGTKLVAAVVAFDLGAIVLAVATLTEDVGSGGSGTVVIGTALTACVTSLAYVVRAVITGRLVPQNVSEVLRLAEERSAADVRIEAKLDSLVDALNRRAS